MSPGESDEAFSDHFDPSTELDTNAPGFDFGANLETHDSVSSLTELGVEAPPAQTPSQPQGEGTDQEATPPVANGKSKENGSAAASEGVREGVCMRVCVCVRNDATFCCLA